MIMTPIILLISGLILPEQTPFTDVFKIDNVENNRKVDRLERSLGLIKPKMTYIGEEVGLATYTSSLKIEQHSIVYIRLSCGSIWRLKPGDCIPTNSIPCTCGNTNHWFWKMQTSDEYFLQ